MEKNLNLIKSLCIHRKYTTFAWKNYETRSHRGDESWVYNTSSDMIKIQYLCFWKNNPEVENRSNQNEYITGYWWPINEDIKHIDKLIFYFPGHKCSCKIKNCNHVTYRIICRKLMCSKVNEMDLGNLVYSFLEI